MRTEHEELVKEVVQGFKDNPNINLAQFNNYIENKQWHERVVMEFFIYRTAIGLAEYYDVSVADYTPNEVFTKVRDWIVETPVRKLAKVILGDVDKL